jgi:hypothetical protein
MPSAQKGACRSPASEALHKALTTELGLVLFEGVALLLRVPTRHRPLAQGKRGLLCARAVLAPHSDFASFQARAGAAICLTLLLAFALQQESRRRLARRPIASLPLHVDAASNGTLWLSPLHSCVIIGFDVGCDDAGKT